MKRVIAVAMLAVAISAVAAGLPLSPRWISGNTAAPEKPAPVLVKEFALDAKPAKAVFNKAFYKGDGLYAEGRLTELAAPLYFKGLCVDGEEKKVATHKTPFDEIRAGWRRIGGKTEFICEVPEGVEVEKFQ